MKKVFGLLSALSVACSHTPPPLRNTLVLNQYIDSVFISDVAKGQIRFLYSLMTVQNGLEMAGCLEGSIRDRKAYITNTALPTNLLPYPDSVRFSCNEDKNYLGPWHTHPVGNPCVFSTKDFDYFMKDEKGLIAAVACEDGIQFYKK